VVIATKVGMEMAPDRKGLSAAHIARSVEESLRRLQTDYIDLYFSHCDDAGVPMEETLGIYRKLIAEGKVRAIGASNFSAARMTEALEISRSNGLPRYEVLQPHYNLYARSDYESSLEWQIARPSITAPISSATTVSQLSELIAATQLKLDAAAIEQLNAAGR